MGKKKRTLCQSAAIPLVRDGTKLKAVLITPRNGDRWIIPKGNIPKRLTAAESAEREAFEEAGVTGRVRPLPIGSYRYEKGGTIYDVAVYVVWVKKVLVRWPEMGERRQTSIY